jgi:hypothetical protein
MPSYHEETTMLNLKTLNATSEMLVRASGKLDKKIAEHLVNIARHINGAGNGDVSAANYFFDLIGKSSGIRKQAIGNWLIAYAGCSYNQEKKKFGRTKSFTFDERAAVENPWYTFTPQPEFQPFDLEAKLKSLLKKAMELKDDAEHAGKIKIRKDLLNGLERMLDPKPDFRVAPEQAKPEAEAQAPEGWIEVEGGSSEAMPLISPESIAVAEAPVAVH